MKKNRSENEDIRSSLQRMLESMVIPALQAQDRMDPALAAVTASSDAAC